MCETSEETTYYVRTVLMYKNLTKEVLFKVFKHLIKSEDIEGFLLSPEQQNKLSSLRERKKPVIDQNEHDLVSHSKIDLKEFDISLLLKLILNLCKDKIQQEDESLGVDLLRLRDIRNEFIGHRADTELPETEYERTWANIKSILLRVVELVDSKSSDAIQQRIDKYETLHLQEKVNAFKAEELFRRSQEFQAYYKGTLERFVRYIKLLFHGGRIVLYEILKAKLGERKMETLSRGNLGDKCSSCLYSKGSCSDDKNWDVSLLADVLLFEYKDDLEDEVIENIKRIQRLRENYATLASQSLDNDEYISNWTDLTLSLNTLSEKIPKGDKQQIKNLIEYYKKKGKEGSGANDYIKQLRKFGVEDEVYNETLTELRDMLNQLSQEGIKFQQEHVFKFILLTTCENEGKKKIANDLLKKYLQASLQQSDEPSGHLRNILDNLIAGMSAVPDVTPVQVNLKGNNQPLEKVCKS